MSESVKHVRARIFLNDKEASGSLRKMENYVRKVRNHLRKLPTDSKEFKKVAADFNLVRAEARKVRDEMYGIERASKDMKSEMSRGFKGMIGMAAAAASSFLGLREAVNYQEELSDFRADVQKTTELTDAEMDVLQGRLDALNTRTSREELLGLAAQAGKLGVRGVADLEKFVSEADQINVALDDLGDGAVLQIGKIADVYETGMLRIGTAVNKVADSSKASAPYLVEWMARMGGTAKAVKIQAAEILGYGATLDELGLKVEMSSTALNGFFIDFTKNSEKFGKVAGFANGELSKLIGNQGANEGFLAFLQRLKDGSRDSADFLRKLEAVGVTGDRGSQVFLALSQNLEKVRDRQKLASEEIATGDSLLQEFLKRNTNFAATMSKVRKWLRATFLDSSLVKGLTKTITFLAQMLGIIEDQDGAAKRWGERIVFLTKLIIIGTTAVLSYKAALKLAELWSKKAAAAEAYHAAVKKGSLFWTRALTVVQALYITATQALTGKIKLATAAQRVWNITMRANPIALVVGLIASLTSAYLLFRNEQERGLTVAEKAKNLNKEAALSIFDEKVKVESLVAILKEESISRENKLKALKELKSIAPDYFGNLDLEKSKTEQLKNAVDQYTESLMRQARAKALQEELVELQRELAKESSKTVADYRENQSWYQSMWGWVKSGGNAFLRAKQSTEDFKESQEESIDTIERKIAALKELQTTWISDGLIDVGGNTEGTSPEEPSPMTVAKPEGTADELLKELIAQYDAELRIREDFEKRRKDLIEKYGLTPEDNQALKDAELSKLKEYLDYKLISEEEYEKAKEVLEDKYHQKALDREEQKRKEYEKTTAFKEEMMRRDMALSAFNAAASARNAEEARSAVLNSIRDQIQGYLAKAVAGAIATEFATKGLLGAITATIAGGTVGALFSQIVPRFNTGGYTGVGVGIPDPRVPGRTIKGYVHDDEYVVASEELRNPDVNQLVKVIENVRQKRLKGFNDGGPVGSSKVINNTTTQNIEVAALSDVVGQLSEVIMDLKKNGIKAVADRRFREDLGTLENEDQYIESKSEIS